jgi:hypothetical protein
VDIQFEKLQERADRNLVVFLRIELDLGFTFARTAHLEADMQEPEDFERAQKIVRIALETVRRFEARIVNFQIRREIQERAAELEVVFSSL